MPASNDFLPFAIDPSANVATQAAYVADGTYIDGFQAGLAKSTLMNKALRQASFISSTLAQLVANTLGAAVIDNGSVSAFLTQLTALFGTKPGGAALELLYQSAVNVTSFLAAPTTAGQQLAFDGTHIVWAGTFVSGTNGHKISPSGDIEQWLEQTFGAGSIIITITYPFPFPNSANMPRVCAANPAASGTGNQFIGVTPVTWSQTGCTIDLGSVPGGGGGVLALDVRGT